MARRTDNTLLRADDGGPSDDLDAGWDDEPESRPFPLRTVRAPPLASVAPESGIVSRLPMLSSLPPVLHPPRPRSSSSMLHPYDDPTLEIGTALLGDAIFDGFEDALTEPESDVGSSPR